jgi:mono/diheme cytochrome c family protein
MKTFLSGAVSALLILIGVATALVWSGKYDVGADEPHYAWTHSVLDTLRVRSVAVRAADIQVPDLQDPGRIRRGAGNYVAMCESCHLAPGVDETELHKGLYPKPPKLTDPKNIDPARAFWVIKHGIKATGMPAWGKSMEDPYIWDMVAFLLTLPKLTPEQYAAEAAASEGHSHGEGESVRRSASNDQKPVENPAAVPSARKPESKPHHHPKGTKPHTH